MNLQTILAIVFLIFLGLILYIKRKKISMQKVLFPLFYLLMYRTKRGLASMDWIAKKFHKPLKYISYLAILTGFLGMILIVYELLKTIFNMIVSPEAVSGVGVVLPFEVKGTFYVPFFYWIISIFILAVVHESSHGIFARRAGIKLKSAGFAIVGVLIPILPAAFVEPDEKQLQKKSKKEQLAVFAAGPFANIVLAFIVLGILSLITAPVAANFMNFNGVQITGVMENKSAAIAGLQEKEIIKEIDGLKIDYLENFTNVLSKKNPGDEITVKTEKNRYKVVLGKNPQNETRPYLGVFVTQNRDIKEGAIEKYGKIIPEVVLWFVGLLYWLFLLNFGIGMFNLVPIGPIDGGRMLKVALDHFFKKETSDKIWKNVSLFFIILVLVIVVFGFLR